MALSPILNVMIATAEKAGRALRRDFGEIENLQVSRKGPGDFVGERAAFLQDGMMVVVEMHEEKAIGVRLPDQVTLEVTDTEPVVKGQTVSSSYKPAVLENGVRLGVPPFISIGDKIVVDTTEVTYLKRAE